MLALYTECADSIAHHLDAHARHFFESHLGPKSQSPTNKLALAVTAQATKQGLQATGRAEPRVGNLCRRFSGSGRQSLSTEKPRPELLSCYHYVQADIRAPACCLHNVSSQCCGFNPQCSAPTYADNRTLPASTFPDQTPSSGQPQILPSKPGAQSRTMLSCKWLHLFLIATRICPGACNPIIAVPSAAGRQPAPAASSSG